MKKLAALMMVALVSAMALPADAQPASYPYQTTVKANNASTRSGPGSWWYVTGKLSQGDRVTVVGAQFGYAQIVPPRGQYSLIAKSDLSLDGSVGTVTSSQPVPVRAAELNGRRLNCVQVLLPPGAKVAVVRDLGQYCQITPPEGATVFVPGEYLADARMAVEQPNPTGTPVDMPDDEPVTTQRASADSSDNGGDDLVQVVPEKGAQIASRPPVATQPQSTARQDYIKLRETVDRYVKLVNAEQAKPMAQRDYAGLKAQFEQLQGEAQQSSNDGLIQYSTAMIGYLDSQIKLQRLLASSTTRPDVDLMGEAQKIISAPAPEADPAAFQASGVLRTSAVFAGSSSRPNMHKLTSADGQKVLCYVQPADASADWSALVGKQVTVTGKRQYKPDWNLYIVEAVKIEAADGGAAAPVQTPAETPAETPAQTPAETPAETPAQNPAETPAEPPAPTEPAPPQPDEEMIFGPRFEGDSGAAPGAESTQPPATERPAEPVPALEPTEETSGESH